MRHKTPTPRRINTALRKDRASKRIEYVTRMQQSYTAGLLKERKPVIYYRRKRSVLDVLRRVPVDPWKRERRSRQR